MSKNCSLAETGDMLKAAQKLVIVSHVSPDGDTLGSSLALMHALRVLGKEVIMNVCGYAEKCGLYPHGLTFSPVTGAKGNIEYLLYLQNDFDKINIDFLADEVVFASHKELG